MNWFGQYERTALWTVIFVPIYILLPNQPLILRTMLATNVASLCYVILTRFAYQRLDSMSLDRWANTPPPPLKTWDLSLLKRLK